MLRSPSQVVAFVRGEIPQHRVSEWWPHAKFPETSSHIIESRGDGDESRFVWCLYIDSLKDRLKDVVKEIKRDVVGLEELQIYTTGDVSWFTPLENPEYDLTVHHLTLAKKLMKWGDSTLLDAAKTRTREWKPFFDSVLPTIEFISGELGDDAILPPLDRVFSIFDMLPPSKIRVIIIGQDPYHSVGQAHGVAFSVASKTTLPPSLRNIFKEIKDNVGVDNTKGYLKNWVDQGVFLINTALTVKEGNAGSHTKLWGEFTEQLMKFLNEKCPKAIVLSWGSHAHDYSKFLTNCRVLRAAHPSPLSASKGFFGCGHFSEVNALLKERKEKPIDWGT